MIILLLLLLIFYLSWQNEDYLYGFWVAEDDDFCEDSGIQSMMLFIGEPTGVVSRSRECYLVIPDEFNGNFTIDYWRPLFPQFGRRYCIKVKSTCELWPETFTLDVNTHTGVLRVMCGDIIYAKLSKRHDITNCCRGADL